MNARWDLCYASLLCVLVCILSIRSIYKHIDICMYRCIERWCLWAVTHSLTHSLAQSGNHPKGSLSGEINVKYTHNRRHSTLLLCLPLVCPSLSLDGECVYVRMYFAHLRTLCCWLNTRVCHSCAAVFTCPASALWVEEEVEKQSKTKNKKVEQTQHSYKAWAPTGSSFLYLSFDTGIKAGILG